MAGAGDRVIREEDGGVEQARHYEPGDNINVRKGKT